MCDKAVTIKDIHEQNETFDSSDHQQTQIQALSSMSQHQFADKINQWAAPDHTPLTCPGAQIANNGENAKTSPITTANGNTPTMVTHTTTQRSSTDTKSTTDHQQNITNHNRKWQHAHNGNPHHNSTFVNRHQSTTDHQQTKQFNSCKTIQL
jgi:hypothetical protein